ncbi:MAG: peptidoglycan DD-metalloendopeptidase family protein, partial [Myxococcales bacterium]
MRALLALLVALVPSLALAAEYRLPLNGCDTPSKCVDLNKCYVTAYMDLDGAANGLRDWNCGQNTYDGHQGTDIAIGGWAAMDASGGSRPVVAAATGTVVIAFDGQFDRNNDFSLCGTSQAPGNHVAIRHPNGFTTVYLHLKKGSVAVTQGQTVSCGDKLGEVGSSGCSTGPHLHFEVNTTSVLFQSPDDPYAAASGCGGPLSYWVDQGPYCRLPGTCCQGGCHDQATFVSETIPDGTTIQPNATFTKKWTLRNSGGSTWTRTAGYQFAFDGEQQFGAPAITQLGASES